MYLSKHTATFVKRYSTACIFAWSMADTATAQNLVLNPSFEDYDSCVLDAGEFSNSVVNHWMNPTIASPDCYNFCSVNPACHPYNAAGSQWQLPRTGNGTAGIIPIVVFAGATPSGEFIEGALISPMIKDSIYCVKFFLSLQDDYKLAVDQFGMYLSNTPVTSSTYFIGHTPQLQSAAGQFFTDTANWMKWQSTYKAEGGERYFVIGNFKPFEETNTIMPFGPSGTFWDSISYYYIDDVSIEQMQAINLGNDSVLCSIASFTHQLSVPAIYDSVRWSTGSGANTILISDTGIYSVIAYTGECEVKDTVRFSLHKTIDPVALNDLTLCIADTPIVISATPGFDSYTWNTGSTNISITVTHAGTYTLAAWEGCTTYRDTFIVTINPTPSPPLVFDTIVCQQNASLSLNVQGNSVKWYADSIIVNAMPTQPVISLSAYDTLSYYVTQSVNSCESERVSVSAFIKSLPMAYLDELMKPCKDDSMSLSLLYDARNSYLWSTGETTNIITAVSDAVYGYTVTNECGAVSGSTDVRFINCDNCIFAPQAFTPNGDGSNDWYQAYSSCGLKYYQLRIFNRIGEKVFETNDQYGKWDGNYKGVQQPANVYVYIVTAVNEDNETRHYKGSLTLIR